MAAKTSSSSSRCDACGGNVGLWQASFTSECAHTFHLRCVSGTAACPSCAAAWSDAPAAAPAPPPATTFSFASASPLFGQTPPATASSSSASTATGAFGPTASPVSNFWGAQPAASPPASQPSVTSVFGQKQQEPPATHNPFWLAPAPTAAQTSSPSCSVCGGVLGRGQATVTSECAHTFHLRCFSGSVCPVCGARWRDEVTVTTPPSPLEPSSSTAIPNPFSSLASTPSLAPPNASSSSPPQPSLFPRYSDFTFAQANPSSSPTFGASFSTPSLFAPPNPSSAPPQSSLFSPSSSPTFRFSQSSGFTLSSPFAPTVTSSTTSPFSASNSLSLFSGGSTFAPGYSPPRPSMFSNPIFGVPLPSSSEFSSSLFNDDEPVEPPAPDGQDTAQETARDDGVLVLETHCESPAVARDAAHDSFAVLLHAKAPAAAAQASARAPIDLVTVLDTSGSMHGDKLALLKQAMGFVIDNLKPRDRLSIVTFSDHARRIIRLMRMSDAGKASAKAAMVSVVADSATNIGGGLRVAADVLDCRRERNAVAGIILLSDGHDNRTPCGCGPDGRKIYRDLVPHSLRRSAGNRSSPVHTFGFGTDHDAAAMQAVAEETGGTFSFIENQAAVQDSFAQCIGGLLSVAVQEASVAVECLHPGVLVRAVKSGQYESRVGVGGRSASVDVGEMYADEERRFLVFLDVPVADEDGSGVTRLIKASCAYRDAATGRSVDVGGEDAVVQRPVVVTGAVPSVEVARERFRVEAAEDLALARAAAERGEHAEAARILDRRQQASAAAGLAGDARCVSLVAELRELSARVADRREYEQTGRAFMLAGITAHAQQRASTVLFTGTAAPAPPRSLFAAGAPWTFTAATTSGLMTGTTPSFGSATASGFGASATPAFGASSTPAFGAAPSCFSFGFATPTMQSMVESSRRTRESAPGTNGSDSNFSFS